ncbi:MAG: NADPH-dependent FMN reductase [Candidatus Magnetoglobus multicellularis str. Araruama]|uniref:NADPH-dependent FMN reductase n=1 Tax=Candidatus Magnetoglobus multicellularis str. Araruama TaxID=890399 RepID=A0A1V1PGY1_9BACT|nr:MAG: NADPH-dependent FMN reductase [Candidatus Magnetoglobus multicellularis str. Araruama]
MKIVCISGSPRNNGNSAVLLQELNSIADNANANIQSFNVNSMTYKGCQACMSCKGKTEECVISDDFDKVLKAISECDLLVLASPVYFADVTAQMKAIIDRMYSFLVPNFMQQEKPSRLEAGKSLIFILTQGQPDEKMFADIYPKYEMFLKIMGFTDTHLIRACGVLEAGAVKQREDILENVRTVAKSIIQ